MVKIVEENIPTIIDLCKVHYLKSLYLFGSATSKENFNSKSDIDFLYEFDLKDYPNWEKNLSISNLKNIVGMRHIVIHNYDLLEAERLYVVIKKNIPILKQEILKYLDKEN